MIFSILSEEIVTLTRKTQKSNYLTFSRPKISKNTAFTWPVYFSIWTNYGSAVVHRRQNLSKLTLSPLKSSGNL